MIFIIALVPVTKPRSLHMPGKRSMTELYLQPGLHIMTLFGQHEQLRCSEQGRAEGVENSHKVSAAISPSSDAAAMRSEGIMRKGWEWTGRMLQLDASNEEKWQVPQACSSYDSGIISPEQEGKLSCKDEVTMALSLIPTPCSQDKQAQWIAETFKALRTIS